MLRELLRDIRRGENLDLYVTLALAIALAVLKPVLEVFGVNISPSTVDSLTMSVLAAITVVLLVNRKRMESLERQLNRQTQSGIATVFPESYSSDLSSSRKILQSGIHLASNLTDYHKQYDSILKNRRSSIRFLIAAPSGSALKMAALRFAGGTRRIEQEQARTASSIDVIIELMDKYPGQVQLKVIDYLLEYAGLLIESANGDEVLYVERYTFRQYGGALKPKFRYTPDSPWFHVIKEEMEELYKVAERYQRAGLDGAP